MASVKIIYYQKKVYSDGTSPVILQVIQGASVKRKVIASVLPHQWNDKDKRIQKKKHANEVQLNLNISDAFTQVEKALLQANGKFLSDPFAVLENAPPASSLTFSQIAQEYLDGLRMRSGWTYLTFSGIVRKFEKYVNNKGFLISEMTLKVVQSYVNYMGGLGNAESTIKTNLKVLRFVTGYAEKHGYASKPAGLHSFKMKPTEAHYKEKLTVEELALFASCPLHGKGRLVEVRDIFLLSVYLRGMRISDTLQLRQSYFKEGRLAYTSQKNHKLFDIKLLPQAIEIISRYLDDREYLFTLFRWAPDALKSREENNVAQAIHLKNVTASINRDLKEIAGMAGIKKNVSTHIAKHTFGKMAIERIKDTNVTMDLLGHSNMKVHQTYIRMISKADDLDDAVEGMFDGTKR